MKKNTSITQIMSEEVKTVNTTQKLSEVRQMLSSNPIHHVPVVSGSKLVGMLSATDILGLSFGGYQLDDRSMDSMLDHQFTIEEVMQKDVVTIRNRETIRDAAQVLAEGSFHSLPVVDDKGHLQGIVTSTDLIRYLYKQY